MALDWVWLSKGFGVANGGSYAKLFQGKGSASDIIAREVTQNSWDAALRLKAELERDAAIGVEVPFRMEYEFRSMVGKDKSKFVKAMQLDDLASVVAVHGETALGLESGATCIAHLADTKEPLKLLYIHDYGATGLRGDPVGENPEESDFYRAFGEIGGNDREVGGGSYGFGKSAFIKASRVRCVVAYSSFQDSGDGVTTRLWGFVYWKGYGRRSGVAQLGALQQSSGAESVPLTNHAADRMAEQLGFKLRTSDTPSAWGTSLLVVDHVLEPEALVESLERFWWPALITFQGAFDIKVLTEKEVLQLKPSQRDYLQPFLRAFEIATKPDMELNPKDEVRAQWRALRGEDAHPGAMATVRAGDVGQIDKLTDSSNPNLVALIREPRMVVCYQPYATGSPNIHGVFVADKEVDWYLRSSEPGAHDEWQRNIDASHGDKWEETKRIVNAVHKRIYAEVLRVKKGMRPVEESDPTALRVADELLSKVFKPSGAGSVIRKVSTSTKRVGSLAHMERTSQKRISSGPDAKLQEAWTARLAPGAGADRTIKITPQVWVVSDGSESQASDRIGVKLLDVPSGFEVVHGVGIVGTLTQDVTVSFTFESEPYNRDWTVKSEPEISDPKAGATLSGHIDRAGASDGE